MRYLSKPSRLPKKAISGFTLIELMIVVAIVAVLTSVAYPSYLESVFKGKRSTAAASILECVALLERRFTLTSTYTDSACNNLNNEDYTISVDVSIATRNGRTCTANNRENCFEVTATSQIIADDACQALTINEMGVKTTVPAGNVIKCWRTT